MTPHARLRSQPSCALPGAPRGVAGAPHQAPRLLPVEDARHAR